MTAKTILKGMTWSDPRGYDPMVATSEEFARNNPDFEIEWDKRSLQDFESVPVDELARKYDLMVIDHPHLGSVAKQNCLLAFDEHLTSEQFESLSAESLGRSFASYNLGGHQWALPIDTAAQVQAFRADKTNPATTWDDVVKLAENGAVVWPLRSPHSLMSFFTLAANLGTPCSTTPGELIEQNAGMAVLEKILAVTSYLDPACFEMDPIASLNAMAESTKFILNPLTYLYKGYSEKNYRKHILQFCDIAAAGKIGPSGSALGGTGIAISAQTSSPEACVKYAFWIASRECQEDLYVASNGQPTNIMAWNNQAVNASVSDAYFNTRLTHEAAWLRPRHDGYMEFQSEGSDILESAFRGKLAPAAAIKQLNSRFAESFK